MAELAGVMVGDYFLLECLAREGIVETYRARPTTHGGYDVVLRLFQPQFPDPSGFSEHFASEVEKLWRCRHSHVQPLLEFGTGDDLLYTATLLTETETLQEFLARQPGRFLPIPLVVRLITQVCAALQYIHEQGMIHGNIQPSSILIRTEGDILLTNFSMKHAYQDSAPLGAPVEEENAAYTAPEQALGIIQPASDIYAVGLLLYQLLTDQLPSEIECRDEDGLSHSNEPARTLGIIRPELPEAVETVVRIALAKNPADRFPDATSLAQAFLAAFVSDEQRVVPDVPPQRVNVHTRRTSFIWARAAWLLSISVLLFALIGASFFAFFFPLHMSDIRMPIFSNGGELWPTGNTPGSTTTPLPPTSLPFSRSGTPTIRGTVPVGRPMPPYGATPTVPTGGPVLTPIPGTTAVPTPPKTTPIPTEPPVICTTGTLSLDGSPNLEPLLQQVNSDYQVACPKLTISLSGDDSSTALNLLQQG